MTGIILFSGSLVPLTAYNEAAIATIFSHMLTLVESEIKNKKTSGGAPDDYLYFRRIVIAAHEACEDYELHYYDEVEEPMTSECEDITEWKYLLTETLAGEILWDENYTFDDIEDICHESDALTIGGNYGIDRNYYLAIPDDPKPERARELLREIESLCRKVFKREKRKMSEKKKPKKKK